MPGTGEASAAAAGGSFGASPRHAPVRMAAARSTRARGRRDTMSHFMMARMTARLALACTASAALLAACGRDRGPAHEAPGTKADAGHGAAHSATAAASGVARAD